MTASSVDVVSPVRLHPVTAAGQPEVTPAFEELYQGLSGDQWQVPVRTAQGRTVPVTDVPWMRSREVHVHAVDLAGSLAEITACLTGAGEPPHHNRRRSGAGPAALALSRHVAE